jgi:hypothetical protein
MAKIIIDIETCSGCPFFKTGMGYSIDGDSWNTVHDWYCKKEHNKRIAEAVEWNEKPAVPTWCPIKIEE